MLWDENLTASGGPVSDEDASTQLAEQDLPRCMNHELIGNLVAGIVRGELDATHASMRVTKLLDVYLEQPFLLDPFLPHWLTCIVARISGGFGAASWAEEGPETSLVGACRIIYTLCKIRGAQAVMPFFGGAVDQVVPSMMLAKRVLQGGLDHPDWWMVRYTAMLMATVALHTPFDLDKFGGRCIEAGESAALFDQVYELVLARLHCSGREREAAVKFLATWYLRKDKTCHLAAFVRGSLERPLELGELECLCALTKTMEGDDLRRLGETGRQLLLALDDHGDLRRNGLVRRCRIKLYGRLLGISSPSRCLEVYLEALRDPDTSVRWSASKGLSRLAKDGEAQFQAHLVDCLVSMLGQTCRVETFPDPALGHGITLCLAELARKSAIPPHLLGDILSLIGSALVFEVPCGRYAAGTAVRDAACYLVWSMVRSYRLDTALLDQTKGLAKQLVCAALFDREVSIRRAAAAAFQELVGRWGSQVVEEGVEILGVLNFFSAHHPRTTYGELALEIADKFPAYRAIMLQHLLAIRIPHWDRVIRELAASLFGRLWVGVGVDVREGLGSLLPMSQRMDDLASQHGAILAMAHLLEHVEDEGGGVDEDILEISCMLTSSSVKPKMLGWEMLADAVFCLIAAVARNHPVCPDQHSSVISSWLSACNQGLQSRDDTLHQVISTRTLPAIVELFPAGSTAIVEYFRGTVLPAADKDRNLNAQRGFTLAIGVFPVWLYIERFAPVNRLLTRIIDNKAVLIEKRVNAIRALGSLLRAIQASRLDIPDQESFAAALSVLLAAMDDYTVDSRGDVGSLVRLAAMQAFGRLGLDDGRFSGKLVRHLVDKLDKLRIEALKIFAGLFELEPHLYRALLDRGYNAREFFVLLKPLGARLSSFEGDLLTGLLSSAGSVNTLIVGSSGSEMVDLTVCSLIRPWICCYVG